MSDDGGPTAIDRIRVPEVARMTGFSLRTVQMMAAAGELPSALQRKTGGSWTFERLEIRRWMKRREEERCRRTSIAAARRGGLESGFADGSIDEAYTRLLGPRRRSASPA
jgi:excisionase family DNA binding protein